jgi:hypothetical protein
METTNISDLKKSFDIFLKKQLTENIKSELTFLSTEEALEVLAIVKQDYIAILQSKVDVINNLINHHN